ncbi:hypothetical protein B296_00005844 [Ensete ventricosum]|uniref:Uncharacterized protein n=1 Tax=Ensete ventricosum TaxID=4639 RepID=A0A426ZQ43_ENSVE|nr:hypothetical protein B296_00005844 [Ensete ventricosum]
MHQLRFPNNDIRAKVFVRKIDFKLRVMRLNRVELFYTFLLYFSSEGSEEERRPTTATPMQGRPPTARPRPRPPCKGAVGCGQGLPIRDVDAARRGRSPQGRPMPLIRAETRRGGSRPRAHPLTARRPQRGVGCRVPTRGYRPRPALPPTGARASARVGCPFARWLPTGKGSRRLRRGNGDDGADGVRGVMASF